LRFVLLCPFSAGTVLWQAQSGAPTLTVCVRGTFTLTPGREAELADVQEPVTADRHLDDDARQSLYTASDLVPYKPRVDVVLVGSAFAADQRPVEALVARISLDGLDKSLGVIGDRVWIEGPDGPEPSAPRPFARMPLRYERAARASDNPLGFDLTGAPVAGALALPNLEAADDEIGLARTVGFGPVLPTASARRGLLQPDGRAWVEGGGRSPAPGGLDFAFYNAAPRDQQIDLVHAGGALLLENLSPRHARLETRLPTVRPKAFLVPGDLDRGIEIALRCDTVWIDTDRGLLTLSWRGFLAVDTLDEDALGALVVAAESKGREIGYKQIAKLFRDGTSASTDGDTFSETNPFGARHDGIQAPRSVDENAVTGRIVTAAASAKRLPVAAPAPIVIEADDATGPPSYEDITYSELHEPTGNDEPRTQQHVHVRRLIEDPFTEEPSTRPLLVNAIPPPDELGAADYARVAVAVERGEAASALFLYGLAVPDLPRLTRAWTERSAADPGFAQAFARALAEARRR
jgi:hypothetical protein